MVETVWGWVGCINGLINIMNIVLFVGAGFSKPFGYPVMNEFLGYADSCNKLDDLDKDLLGKMILEARNANSFYESSPSNLEDILSFVEMESRLRLKISFKDRYDTLKHILRKVYTDVIDYRVYWERYEKLKVFLGKDLKEFAGDLSIITTNYDLNIESACHFNDIPVNPGFDVKREKANDTNSVGMFYGNRGVNLFKLHGSVNWYPGDNGVGVLVNDYIVPLRARISDKRQPSLPYVCVDSYKPPSSPVIIPPSFLKPDLPQALKDIWAGAAKCLANASLVVFIGYSFPPSDTEMMFFLATAFAGNSGLREIRIVDPKADEITKRIRSSGSKFGSHFRELVNPVNMPWQDVKLKL